jgi:hypothetical protein
MTERFGKERKIRRSESANDRNESRIFGSNSAYSGANRDFEGSRTLPLCHAAIWTACQVDIRLIALNLSSCG